MDFDAYIIIGQSFPAAMLELLDKHLRRLADKLLTELLAMLVITIKQALAAGLLHFFFDLIAHTGRWRTLARREAENVRFRKGQLASQLVRLLKIVVALARKAGDNIGANGDAGYLLVHCCDDCMVTGAIVATGHFAWNIVRTALHG